MNDNSALDFLKANGFRLVGDVRLLEDDRMICAEHSLCEGANAPGKNPSVYAFLRRDLARSNDQIVYIGVAGQGWANRRGQHNGGYQRARNRKSSGAHQGRIGKLREYLDSGSKVLIYERPSATTSLFGQTVHLHEAEEAALILRFDPPLNVRKKGVGLSGLPE